MCDIRLPQLRLESFLSFFTTKNILFFLTFQILGFYNPITWIFESLNFWINFLSFV